MDDLAQALHSEIAENIKAFRSKRQLTLTGLAEMTGIGKSTLSNLERGVGNPTIETIWRLAQVLDVGYGDLVGTAPPQPSSLAGVSVELINREEAERKIETFRMTFEGAAHRQADAHAAGVTENVFVLRGSLTVGRADDPTPLNAGDSITFAADVAHLYQAADAGAQAIVSVIYPKSDEVFQDNQAIRLDWPRSAEAWAGLTDLVTRLCVESKHGIPFARVHFIGCELPYHEAYTELVKHLGGESSNQPGMSMRYSGHHSPEIIILANAGTHEPLPAGQYPEPIAHNIALSNRAARRAAIEEQERHALNSNVTSTHVCLSTLSAEILTRAGYATAPYHVGIKDGSGNVRCGHEKTVLFEDRIDVHGYAAFELVHPAYGRQCVEVAAHLHRVNARDSGCVLDVGSGPGVALSMVDELAQGVEFLAVDPSRSAYPYLEARFADNPRVSTLLASLEDLASERLYTHVVSIGASHHLDTTVFLAGIRDRLHCGGTLCVSDEMIASFGSKSVRRDNLLAHHLRYVYDTLVPVNATDITDAEAELVQSLRQAVPDLLYNALAGAGALAAAQVKRLLHYLHTLDLPCGASASELAFYRFHVLEIEALVAGLDYEVEQKTSPPCFLDLAHEIGFELIEHRRIYATHGRSRWDGGTHIFALEAV